ncbi:glycine cleavage system H protein [Chloropicon primus]|uniref:Glycine cleavage system H protein n=1 Tax=Chloropicon primus TaxID=1764295 RepID=A0A5B8MZ63_9CHLO|nr:glycine cleavage system H protein [Chloropicon primus]UPR04964.1 glycine cleavage system H protein [Chloropicon primus]|mmetsp:Transcript_35640/g.77529  ORF Transcript_35640/g.77529 Transcript_35640/m.77529 type:complete len:202 (-) Transcript_35640:223-828(-)|eukprot:QDZ25769.1 glycine cleavage system H protein [Chloropicon primus]
MASSIATTVNIARQGCNVMRNLGALSVLQTTGLSKLAASYGTASLASEATSLKTLAGKSQAPLRVQVPFAASRDFATVVDGLKYAESHEWVKMDGGTATVGITDFAQSELGDVVFVELPEVGSTLDASETFGVVESVKAASDVYAPVSGEVVEINEALVEDPSKLNTEPFEGGWMMKIKVSDAGELDSLMDSAAYSAACDE